MKDLQKVATKCMLVGILVRGSALAQDIKAQREGVDVQQTPTGDVSKDGKHESNKHFGGNFKYMDTDGDGEISKAEFDSSFAKMDTNGDGYLSSEECEAGEKQTNGRSYKTKSSGR
jgi:Ca2+-binding EF-hand superfamily protein